MPDFMRCLFYKLAFKIKIFNTFFYYHHFIYNNFSKLSLNRIIKKPDTINLRSRGPCAHEGSIPSSGTNRFSPYVNFASTGNASTPAKAIMATGPSYTIKARHLSFCFFRYPGTSGIPVFWYGDCAGARLHW